MYNEPKDVRGLRVGAAFIDYFVFNVIFYISIFIQAFMQFSNLDNHILFSILFYLVKLLISFFYFTLFPYLLKGRTLGKLLIGIKVLSYNYEKASIYRLLFRNIYFFYFAFINGLLMLISFELSFIVSFLTTYIMFFVHLTNLFFVLLSKEARGFHDFIAGTIVVHKNFDLNKVNAVNAIERRDMDWAIFEDEINHKPEKKDQIMILNETEDEIAILKKDD